MIYNDIIHPDILKHLAGAGHGSTVLIADGNFPTATAVPAGVPRVYLNLAPGVLSVPEVLKHIIPCVPIEAATAPIPNDGSEPPIFPEYRELLPHEITITKVNRFEFYDAVNKPELALIIATGERRPYACMLLTIGVRRFQ